MAKRDDAPRVRYKDYLAAVRDYLRRPKTIFDIKDRLKALLLLCLVIIVLRQVVQILTD